MRVIHSHSILNSVLDPEESLWVYNCLDCSITAEIFEATHSQLGPEQKWIYSFEKALRAPALEMMLRGIRTDPEKIAEHLELLGMRQAKYSSLLSAYGEALLGRPINPGSYKQLQHLFYEVLGLPVQTKYDRKEKKEKITTDREALEKLQEDLLANPICLAILGLRDVEKQIQVLRSGVDKDGKMRFSFNVAGTDTGRWSSSKNIYLSGMNAQNVTEELRSCFIASAGFKFCNIDLEQSDSKGVAFLSGDKAYQQACLSGDLHTVVAKLIWPELPWTGTLASDRALAERLFYRHFSYRDMSKRAGHATNFIGAARTIAKALKIETKVVQKFQESYFRAFPEIGGHSASNWHRRVAKQLQTTGVLVTPFGRRRTFLDRLWDTATLRKAVAFLAQSMTADYINKGLLLCWYNLSEIRVLAQVHDSIFFEYPEGREDLCFAAAKLISQPWNDVLIPCEISIGWNWGKRVQHKDGTTTNPHGLSKLKPGTTDTRTGPIYAKFGILDRRLS